MDEIGNRRLEYTISVSSESSQMSTSPIVSKRLPKPTQRRFWMLLFFSMLSMSNAFQWIQYSIITNTVSTYYGVSFTEVDWTSVIFMVVYIPGIIPSSWFLDKKGLRWTLIVGAFMNSIGAWIKCLSTKTDGFYISMLGQSCAALAQLFILNIPPHLSAVWFPHHEISRATAFGVFGNQLGIAIGFLVPPFLVDNVQDKNIVQNGLLKLFFSGAIFTSVAFLLIVIFFRDKPSSMDSNKDEISRNGDIQKASGISLNQICEEKSYWNSLSSLFSSKNFFLLLLTYGINVGTFYAVSTLLSQIIVKRFPDGQTSSGVMGLLLTITGMAGSVISGYILDKTHKYKMITLMLYICSLFSMVIFCGFLRFPEIWPMYIIAAILGFFLTGYLPIGFEFGVELSYPEPEGTSSGLLNASSQVFGIAFTLIGSQLINNFGDLEANLFFISSLLTGSVLTFFIKPELKRQNVFYS